jgi:hypothetical protein
MQSNIIHDLTGWQVTSWGNGLSYEVFNKLTNQDIFFQGEDAEIFRNQLEELTEHSPHLGYSDALRVIWNEYAEAFQVERV